ncbi:hypothetical protein K2173_010689 [Erythroxylum novogranatense]|uniref:Uncharacterized protein n=1 Tax=Erythroxylum novogranatense TaxID=1862640 RepID=A0AAV8SRA3_9ROSI|nr:hypothetical protein K2173_010689 [Erythroxylum novogranatense]
MGHQSAFACQNQSRIEPILEPQVLFVYPPGKELPLKYKDLLSFCFTRGLEILFHVCAVERTPSMSEMNEILLGQEHLKQSDFSFVFRLQVKWIYDAPLFLFLHIPFIWWLIIQHWIVQKPSGLLSRISDKHFSFSSLSRHVLTKKRCYCILMFTEERLERLTKDIGVLELEALEDIKEEKLGNNLDSESFNYKGSQDIVDGAQDQLVQVNIHLLKKGINDNVVVPIDCVTEMLSSKGESGAINTKDCNVDTDDFVSNKQTGDKHLPIAILPLLRYCYFQGSPSDDRNFRSDATNHGSLQILCEYYQLHCPVRVSTLRFQPLELLHPLEYHRPVETVLHIAGSTIDLRSCSTNLEFAEVSTLFAGALLEKQIVVVCSLRRK